MIRRTVKVQLAVFGLLTLLTVAILSARYVGLTDKILGGTYVVQADFQESGGIFVGSEVTYRGVTVGRVESLELTKDGVLVQARINRGVEVPKDTNAVVENRSAVGEQYLDLQPNVAGAPYLAAGATIPRSATSYPVRVDILLQHTDNTVRSVDQKDLSVTVDEFGKAFATGSTDLKRLLDSGDALTASATAALPETVKLIYDARIVLDTQRETSSHIKVSATDFANLAETFRDHDQDLRLILDRGVVASQQLDGLIKDNQSSLSQLFANFITIGNVTTSRLGAIEQLLVTYPDVVAGGYTVVPGDGTAHFGFVANSDDPPACTRGYEATTKVQPTTTENLPPLNTSAGCRLPRGSASAVRGAQNAPRPSSGAASSYPMAFGSQPVTLGSSAVTANNRPVEVATPMAPSGASGVDSWLWMMKAAAQ